MTSYEVSKGDAAGTLYKPMITRLLFGEGVSGVFLLISAGYFSYLSFTAQTDNSMKAFLAFLGIGGFIYGCYSLSLFWKIQLIISTQGILYKEPFLSIYCDWPHIKGFMFSKDLFVLKPDENIKPKKSFLILIRSSKRPLIPIYLFVKSWKEQEDWQRNALLKSVAFYLPGIEEKILENIKLGK